MKKVFVALFFLITAFSYSQQKHALVIGNGAYTNFGTLPNAVNDANDMAGVLQSLGFTVDKLLNGNLTQMENAAIRLRDRLAGAGKNTYGFFYYAGHGIQADGVNYLIPANANIPDKDFLRERAVSAQTVLDMLNRAHNALNIVVLDACRDFPAAWSRSTDRGLAVMHPPVDSIVMYATAAGRTAADGKGRNGLFTSYLLQHLKTPGIEVNEVFRRTMSDVARASNNLQRPAMYTDFSETAYLGARPAAAVAPQAAPPQTGSQPAPAAAVQPAAAPAANWQLSRSINARGECMALSPDGTYLAAGYTTVGIWNVETGEKSSFRGTIPPNEDRNSIVRSLAFSPDGKFVAFGGGNAGLAVKPGSMGVWNIETKRELWILNAGASIFSVSFSPDGRYIASASGDGTVKLWDAATGRNVKTIGSHSSGWAMSAAFSPDGRYIVSGSERGDIKIWNTETSREIAALKHSGRIYSAVFSPNGKFIVSGGGDTIKIWDAHLFKEIRTIDPKRSSIRAATISPDCRRIAAAFDITDRIAVYDVETGGELWVSDRASHGAESVVFDPGGNRIFSSWWNGGISIWKNE